MEKALTLTKHPMIFSCEWPLYDYLHKKTVYSMIFDRKNYHENFRQTTLKYRKPVMYSETTSIWEPIGIASKESSTT